MDQQNEKLPTDGTESSSVVESPAPPMADASTSWRPADYYAVPPAARRFPRWVSISCGIAAIVALAFMFAIGAFLRSGGLASFVALAIGQFQGELGKMVADDVAPESREKLDESLRALRERLTSGELEQGAVLPLLQEIQKVTRDEKVTAEEIDALQALVDEAGGEPQEETQASPEPVEL